MRTPDETEESRAGAPVPVEVTPGHPTILQDVTFPDDFESIMLLGRYRVALEQARAGTAGMLPLRTELILRSDSDRWVSATEAELNSVRNWADELLKKLDKHDPLKRVLAVSEDFLGVYAYDASDCFADEYHVNRASIRFCWGVIGLRGEDINWSTRTICFTRKKLKSRGTNLKPTLFRFSAEIEVILKRRPAAGPLFPYLCTVRAGDRATEFKQRCDGLGISGVSLHSYRYAWAERALKCGFPERFAQQALGHNSKAVHRAYAKHAEVTVPSLDDWEIAWERNLQGSAKPKLLPVDFR